MEVLSTTQINGRRSMAAPDEAEMSRSDQRECGGAIESDELHTMMIRHSRAREKGDRMAQIGRKL
ncbi:hypothetical protein DW352_05320 [Pseudolabrys taiwanensis]|uniref:Uncharacterized protein n=1 Tax=Pseudolabrys taiwanensis TaxID=331696 RepID=A0A345ZSU2_9HYPH|nr:hypothetical protein DW352_05320 [Pseudolabrys taiwanensis]